MNSPKTDRVLAIIAGARSLPRIVAESARSLYREVHIIRILPFCTDPFDDFPNIDCKVAAYGRLSHYLKKANVDDILFAGNVYRAPLLDLGLDLGFLLNFPSFLAALAGGDNKVLMVLIGKMEGLGLRVVGCEEVAPQLIAPLGFISKAKMKHRDVLDVRLGRKLLDHTSVFDVGQCAVVRNQHVLALEAAEGTLSMLQRVAGLTNSMSRHGGVMIKMAKRGQDLRIDRPVIGPDTVTAAAAAGLSGIAYESGIVLVANIMETVARANELGIFLFGFDGACDSDEDSN